MRERVRARLAEVGPTLVGVLVVLLLAARGRWWGAVLLLIVLVGVTQARTLSPAFARRFALGVHRFALGLGHLVSWVLLGAAYVLVFLPVSLVRRLVGRTPLGRPRGLGGRGWIPRRALGPSPPRRGFGAEPGRVVSEHVPRPITALALVGALVVLDLLTGSALTALGLLRPDDRGDIRDELYSATAGLMAQPPVAGEPWGQQYGRDLAAFQLDGRSYVPYVANGYHEFHSEYVNSTDTERVSYRPPGEDPLQVGFFGGSVMFGVGQRDEHTIPSAFARVAEEHGVDVEVHNYGFPGWVAWQEAQLLERRLAAGQDLDLAVFLDGFNELHLQDLRYSPDPTHIGVDVLQGFVDEFDETRRAPVGWFDQLGDLASAYGRTSAVARLVGSFGGDDDAPPPAPTADAAQRTAAALDVYARAIRLVDDITDDHDVPAAFFWQPRRGGWPAEITDRLDPRVVDLGHTFDGEEDERYLDDVHTDEDGARQLAEAMWAELGPRLEAAR
jgi:lysophospholipase L1-like esterase